jgi:Ni,Fe-hydrogenase I cytochrome b subunit
MPPKFVLPVCAACSSLAAGSLANFQPGSFWFWIVLAVSAVVSAVMASIAFTSSNVSTGSSAVGSERTTSTARLLWVSVSVSLLLYALTQIYIAIVNYVFVAFRGAISDEIPVPLFATVPPVVCVFAFLLGATMLSRVSRPFIAGLCSSLFFVLVVAAVQVGFIAFGQTSHLIALESASLTDIALGFTLSLLAISVSLLLGVLLVNLADRITSLLVR